MNQLMVATYGSPRADQPVAQASHRDEYFRQISMIFLRSDESSSPTLWTLGGFAAAFSRSRSDTGRSPPRSDTDMASSSAASVRGVAGVLAATWSSHTIGYQLSRKI